MAQANRRWTIGAQLYALVGAIVFPLAIVLGYAIFDRAAASLHAAEMEALRLAQITAADSGRLLGETRGLLAGLAGEPLVRAVRVTPQCDALMARVNRHQTRYTNLMVAEADGDVVCSGVPVPPGFPGRLSRPLPLQDGERGHLFVGKPSRGETPGKWVVPVFYSLWSDSRLEGYVVAAIDLEQFYPVAGLSALPEGAVAVIVDDEWMVVTRSVDPGEWTGRRFDAPQLQALMSRGGTGRATGPDGVDRLYGVMPVAGIGWTAAVGLPAAPLMAGMRDVLLSSSLLALAIVGLALALSVLVARRIVVPIRGIAATAKAVAEGEVGRRAPIGGAAEVAAVGAAFNAMLEAIHAQREALRLSEARWQFALEGHGDGLWEWSAQDGKVFFSRQWKAMLGYREDEMENSMEAWESLVHPDDRAEIARAMQQHLKGAVPRYYAEYRLRAKDGGYRWTAAHGRIMEWGAPGLPARVIGTQRDITERKQQEEREHMRQEQLVHSGRLILIGEMASALAHELNQPLTAIASYAGVCVRRMDMPEPSLDQLRVIMARIGAQAQRAGDIVWHIRDFVRKRETERLPIDIGAMVREMVGFAEIEASAGEVVMTVELDDALPPALADKLQVEQVLLNLIKNGIEAMRETEGGRRLRIAARMTGAGEIEVSVSDCGHGLPDRVAMDIFTPFFTTKPEGLGLGLAISRSIIEAHGGRLWAMPNAAAGTSFNFTLPIAPGLT
jgi:PAS domain S-box-containing protein